MVEEPTRPEDRQGEEVVRTALAVFVVIVLCVVGIMWLMDQADQRCADKGGKNVWLGGGLQHICVDKDGRIIR